MILLHDEGLERLTWSSEVKDVRQTDWDSIKNIDIGSLHVNRFVKIIILLRYKYMTGLSVVPFPFEKVNYFHFLGLVTRQIVVVLSPATLTQCV